MPAEKPYASEVALCAAFIAAVGEKWVAYAETQSWDILLVRKRDGFQIGVQAKLRLNADVMAQALESRWSWARDDGPDCRALLVPRSGTLGSLSTICGYVGLTVIRMEAPTERYRGSGFEPALPEADSDWISRDWYEWCPIRRMKLPGYIPDVAAGASAPTQLTDWKISAIKIAITLDIRGFVTKNDFKHHRIDPRRWMIPRHGWLKPENGRYVANAMPNFRLMHPRVYEEIAADAEKWILPRLGPELSPQPAGEGSEIAG